MARLFLRKSQRIVSEADFNRVLSYKCFVCKGILRLYAAANGLAMPRFGVSVSKSCGNAVARNKLKRFAREAFRLHQHEIDPNFDYILIITQKKPKSKKTADNKRKETPPESGYKEIESGLLTMVRALSKKMTGRFRDIEEKIDTKEEK